MAGRLCYKMTFPIFFMGLCYKTISLDELKGMKTLRCTVSPALRFGAAYIFAATVSRLIFESFCTERQEDDTYLRLTWQPMGFIEIAQRVFALK